MWAACLITGCVLLHWKNVSEGPFPNTRLLPPREEYIQQLGSPVPSWVKLAMHPAGPVFGVGHFLLRPATFTTHWSNPLCFPPLGIADWSLHAHLPTSAGWGSQLLGYRAWAWRKWQDVEGLQGNGLSLHIHKSLSQ